MFRKYSILVVAGLIAWACTVSPASAQDEAWSVGAGWWTLPNVDTGDVAIDTSGLYASAVMKSTSYMLEFDYAFSDPAFFAMAADYLYPLGQEGNYFGSTGGGGTYVGAGYTYFSSEDLEDENGFNVLLGADLGNQLFGSIRYDFLGSDQELFTIGLTYSF